MAKLPSNTFIFNYNAKQYDPTTHTFPKTEGQLFDEDLVLNTAPNSYTEDSVYFGNSNAYMGKTYSNANLNPLNRSSSLGNNFTFIYKTKDYITPQEGGQWRYLISNRNNAYNWMILPDKFHTSSSSYLQYTVNTNPQYVLIRVNTNGSSERKVLDANGNVLQSASASTISWGNISNGFGFFSEYATSGGKFNQTLYWMYCSLETLTDEEVLKVIQYNEGNLKGLSIDPESATFSYDSGTTTVDITAEGGWTASTNDSWITLSDSTGTGDSTITITVPNNYNNSSDRVGTVVFTDGEEVLTLTVTQKADTRVILKNLYRSGTSIKQMYRSGVRIYQQVFRLIFNVDTDSITFDNTGGTYTINITANEKWTMTIPNWLNASSLSGTGNASIIISTNSVPESKLEGQIIINCENLTHTIDVEQKKAGTDLSTPLTFEILSDGYINWMVNGSTSYARTIQYSLNDGEWTSITSTSSGVHIQVLTGDEIKFRADNTNYSNGSSNFSTFMNGTATYNAKGNIMSMVDSTNYESNTTIPANYCFYRLFRNSKIVSAEDLLFPATTLKNYCYGSIFSNNTLLVTPPTILPATTLVEGCYQDFFAGCSSLTTAPELPAPTLVTRSYYAMFTNCTSLNYIKCLATNISASRCTEMWTNNISATGTFVKDANMSSWTTGTSGIPTNWTVQDAS